VSGGMNYLRLAATRTRAPLVPLTVSIFALLGIFAYRRNEVGASWGLTALVCCALAAWVVGAILDAEPGPQADITTAALGGRRGRARLELRLVVLVAVGLTVAFLAYPPLLGLFDRPVQLGDVAAAAFAHLSCGLLGGTIAVLYSQPRIMRRPTGVAAVTATFVLLVAISVPLGNAGGPVAVAHALTHARPGAVSGAELLACLSCLALAVIGLGAATTLARRFG
jgi:hypothetical protein